MLVVVVNHPKDYSLELPGVRVVKAEDYLTDRSFSEMDGAKVFNLCRSYRYQSTGYYVSLLAAARGHRPIPTLATILGLRSRSVVRVADDELDSLIQRTLSRVRSKEFELSVYFGSNISERHAPLARRLFGLFPAPFLKASFDKDEKWHLRRVQLIPSTEIPTAHAEFVTSAARAFFERPRLTRTRKAKAFDLAILHDPKEELPPSDPTALRRFEKAADAVGFEVELIEKEDYGRLAEFDALFIRSTTSVNHFTYRFAQRARAEGLAVVDDPECILRCTNKVFLAELLDIHDIPIPKTLLLASPDAARIGAELGFPCVLKHPDGSFSRGVVKCTTEEEAIQEAKKILDGSDLLVAQEYLPTPFDWRIGILSGQPLYACRYQMAPAHWQIVRKTASGRYVSGKAEPIPLDLVPKNVLTTAKKAAGLIGSGLYGVDLKQIGKRCVVIEVNDNPSIDSGVEDALLGQELYRRIMQDLMDRVIRIREIRS